jgi:membrane protein
VLAQVLRWVLLVVLVVVALAVTYRVAPDRDLPRFAWVSTGSLVATVLWITASALFSWYVATFDSYNKTYGSLGASVGFMMWLWLSAVIVLLGGELNAEMEHQTAQDTTTGPEKPLGSRGAAMADEVGEARA